MDRISKNIGVDGLTLTKALNFLPYPFLVSQGRDEIQSNIFVNNAFLDEIGYSIEEIPSIDDWFEKAYPDPIYKKEIIAEWRLREEKALNDKKESVILQAKIHTKNLGEMWYEVKATIYGSVQFVAFINIDAEIKKEEALQRLNENKTRTLSILSHDLRSPLSNLFTVLQLVASGDVNESEKNEMIKKLSFQVFQMIEFLDTTLHWSRANFSELHRSYQLVELNKITESILNLYKTAIGDKQLQTELNINQDPAVWGDPEIFSILIRNLISNAIKYTPVNGQIKIYNSMIEGQHKISIENTGIGISHEKILTILEKDYMSERGTNGEKGLGLGLKLCQQLLERISGKLEIESPTPNKTVFRIVI
jgi:signal transduction histidine kinase